MAETPKAASPAAAGPGVLGVAGSSDALLRKLEWSVIRRLDGLLQGDYRTLFRGGGVDLADLREYQLHDDVRHIDWNVTARLSIPHVREFLEERDLTAWFLLDLSASVDFGSQRRKREVSEAFLGVMASLVLRHGCWATPCTAKLPCTANMAAWCPSWPAATISCA